MFRHINKGNFSTHTHTQVRFAEQGRSLVEMLGALAIMGILSMAGIWAYNTAMDKLKANTIINEAQKRAVVIAGQIGLMGSTHPTLGEFKENTFGGGTFSTSVTTEGLYQQFGIQVAGVPKTVCQNILNSIGEGSAIRRLSPVDNPQTCLESCQDQDTFLIIYNNNASSTGGDVIYCDNSFCQTVCGQCISENGQKRCVNECPGNVGEQCSATQPCSGDCVGCVIPEGDIQGTCQSCKPVAYLESSGTQYIDTQYKETSSTNLLQIQSKISPDFSFDIIGNCNGYSNGTKLIGFNGPFGNIFLYYKPSGARILIEIANTENTKNVEATYNKSTSQMFISDGTTKKYDTFSGLYSNNNYFLFWRGHREVNPMSGKIYTLKIRQNATLVRDFIPVHAPFRPVGKQNCMYDKVSKALFCNVADGDDFIIPAL